MGSCCSSKDDKENIDDKFITKPITYNQQEQLTDDLLHKTLPPCWFGYDCPCHCHKSTANDKTKK